MLNFIFTSAGPAFDYSALEPHELANLLPMIDDVNFANLKADFEKNGILEPILLFEGKILDGRNRYRAGKAVERQQPGFEEKIAPLWLLIRKHQQRIYEMAVKELERREGLNRCRVSTPKTFSAGSTLNVRRDCRRSMYAAHMLGSRTNSIAKTQSASQTQLVDIAARLLAPLFLHREMGGNEMSFSASTQANERKV